MCGGGGSVPPTPAPPPPVEEAVFKPGDSTTNSKDKIKKASGKKRLQIPLATGGSGLGVPSS